MRTRIPAPLLLGLALVAPGAAGEVVYDNTANPTGSNGILGGNEWADDLHLTKGGEVDRITFGFLSNGSSQATIRLYANDATDSTLPVSGAALHTEVVSIPGGGASGLKVVDLAAPVTVPAHLWVSIQFDTNSGGTPLANPPTVGSSHSDRSVHVASGFVFDWGANFRFAVRVKDPAPPWTDLGHALAGTAGSPSLVATGSLVAGTNVTFALSQARPNATAHLILGASQANLLFFGGILVPTPTAIFAVPVDGAGALTLGATTPPALPSGVPFVAQIWIEDPLGPAGFAASNGVSATTP